MVTAYVPIGLPCSGKTTFGNRLSEILSGSLLSLGPDDIREHLYPGYAEGLIPFEDMDLEYTFDVARVWADDILRNGYSLWWDAVNTNPVHRAEVIYNCRKHAERIVAVTFDVPFEIVTERNENVRAGHRRPPIRTLLTMADQMRLSPVKREEGFDEVWGLQWREGGWSVRFHSPGVPDLEDPVMVAAEGS